MSVTPNKLLFIATLPVLGLFILLCYGTNVGFAIVQVVVACITFTLLMTNVWIGWWTWRRLSAQSTGIRTYTRYNRTVFAALMVPASAVSAYLTLIGWDLSFVFPMLLAAITPVACAALVAIVWTVQGLRWLRQRAERTNR